jgi:acetyltransferase
VSGWPAGPQPHEPVHRSHGADALPHPGPGREVHGGVRRGVPLGGHPDPPHPGAGAPAKRGRAQIEAGFEQLSEASRRSRFFTPLEQLPESLLRYLTELDYRDHVAPVAGAIDDPGEPGVAIARYIRCADDPDCAEAAVTVLDDYQRRGIATVLLQALALIALQNDITLLRLCPMGEPRGR